MDKIVYLYGSARDSATRALRRGTFPREMQIRVGPWVVRPSRRVAVEFARMIPHMTDVLAKVKVGAIQVQRLDSSLIPNADLLQACEAAKPTTAVVVETLPLPPVVVLSAAPTVVVIEEVVVPVATPAIVPEPTPEPVVVEPIPEAPIPADAEVSPAVEKTLPYEWRSQTNRELISLCTDNGVKVPEKITKASLIQALESWLTEV